MDRMIAKSAGSFLLAAFVFLAPAARAEEPGLFEQAVAAFAEGDSPKAAGLFQKFLAMNPSPADARRLATGQHETVLFSMLGDDACRDSAARLLSMASFASERVAADPETVRGVVRECLAFGAEDDSAAVWEAESRLARVGEGAAPVLLEEMSKTREQNRRARVAALVEKTGPAILLPWTECLAVTDPDLRSLILHLVGRMLADNRCVDEPSRLYALAHVQSLRDDEGEPGPVREEAAEILKRHGAPIADSSGAVESFIRAGERFFLSEPARLAQTRVGRLSLPLSQVWMWDAAAQGLRPLDLASFAVGDSTPLPGFVPTFAVNEIMAQVSAVHALRREPASSAAMALFACGVYAELSENRQIQESGRDYPEMSAFLPVLAARETTLTRETARLTAMGCANLSGALRLALTHNKMGAASHLLGLVADLGRGLPLPASESEYQAQKAAGLARLHRRPAGKDRKDDRQKRKDDARGQPLSVDLSPLIDALDCPNPLIQYRAALALASFDPAKPFYRFDRVVPLLARAVGDITPQAVLVASSDAGFANELADMLQSLGYAAIRAVSPEEAIQKARDFPSKDAILIDHRMAGKIPVGRGYASALVKNRKEAETAPEIFLHLQQDVRTKGVPTWILLPEGDVEPSAYGSAPIAGFLRRPVSRDVLEENLAKTLATSTHEESLARSTALAASATLGGLDRRRSIFAPALGEAAKSLASAIRKGAGRRGETLADAYRLPFLAALARVGSSPEAVICLQAAEDAANSVEVRVAAIRTAGEILGNARPAPLPPDAVPALRRLAGSPDDETRTAAAWALGRLDLAPEEAGRLTLGAPPPEPVE